MPSFLLRLILYPPIWFVFISHKRKQKKHTTGYYKVHLRERDSPLPKKIYTGVILKLIDKFVVVRKAIQCVFVLLRDINTPTESHPTTSSSLSPCSSSIRISSSCPCLRTCFGIVGLHSTSRKTSSPFRPNVFLTILLKSSKHQIRDKFALMPGSYRQIPRAPH